MSNQIIPKLTSEMLKSLPDQTVAILNRVIDKVNGIEE